RGQGAATAAGRMLLVGKGGTESEVAKAFASAVEQQGGGLLVQVNSFLQSRRGQLVALAARHRLPAVYYWRDFSAAGGLMSYGTSLRDALRLVGNYSGRILKGGNPADLPVPQSVKVEL